MPNKEKQHLYFYKIPENYFWKSQREKMRKIPSGSSVEAIRSCFCFKINPICQSAQFLKGVVAGLKILSVQNPQVNTPSERCLELSKKHKTEILHSKNREKIPKVVISFFRFWWMPLTSTVLNKAGSTWFIPRLFKIYEKYFLKFILNFYENIFLENYKYFLPGTVLSTRIVPVFGGQNLLRISGMFENMFKNPSSFECFTSRLSQYGEAV